MSENRIKSFVAKLYQSRRLKLSQPEGYFDIHGCWYPHPHERAGDKMENVKKPTPNNRYSYRIHCRSKAHCRLLISRALAGYQVPGDVLECLSVKRAPTELVQAMPEPKPTDTIPGLTKGNMGELVKEFILWMAARDQRSSSEDHRSTDRTHANA